MQSWLCPTIRRNPRACRLVFLSERPASTGPFCVRTFLSSGTEACAAVGNCRSASPQIELVDLSTTRGSKVAENFLSFALLHLALRERRVSRGILRNLKNGVSEQVRLDLSIQRDREHRNEQQASDSGVGLPGRRVLERLCRGHRKERSPASANKGRDCASGCRFGRRK